MQDAAGWYGKLPSLGDFATRRLPPDFVETWDDWLATGLAAWRGREPDQWLARYLAGPSWRFIVLPGTLPGACGTTAWTGVLMPSVDNVGRYFPLTLTQSLAAVPDDPETMAHLLGGLQRLDDVALDALHEDWSVETLEAELSALVAGPGVKLEADPVLVGQVLDVVESRYRGTVLWLCSDTIGRCHLQVSDGLPQGDAFAALLGAATPDSTPPISFESENP